MDKRDM